MTQTRWMFESNDARAASATRRSFVAFALAAWAESDVDPSGAELVLGELIGNAKRYAPGPVVVEAAWQREEVTITVSDTGKGFERPAAEPEPRDLMAESGRGLFLVNALARDVQVSCEDAGCTVRAVIPLD